MVPIHDTDIAEERWSKEEWTNYELWEKIEHRLRRRKWMWIGATVALFLVLSSVPIVIDRAPKWAALAVTRRLAQEVNRVKREAAIDHRAVRIRFAGDGSLNFEVERLNRCSDVSGEVLRSGHIESWGRVGQLALLSHSQGLELGIPGLVHGVCYDPLAGADLGGDPKNLIGFGVVPAQDLQDKRIDRVAVLTLKGPAAELSFE